MIFHNPYFVFLMVLMAISLISASVNDGLTRQDTTSFMTTLLGTTVQFLLIYGAVTWAVTH